MDVGMGQEGMAAGEILSPSLYLLYDAYIYIFVYVHNYEYMLVECILVYVIICV